MLEMGADTACAPSGAATATQSEAIKREKRIRVIYARARFSESGPRSVCPFPTPRPHIRTSASPSTVAPGAHRMSVPNAAPGSDQGTQFSPYIAASEAPREFSIGAIILGVLL